MKEKEQGKNQIHLKIKLVKVYLKINDINEINFNTNEFLFQTEESIKGEIKSKLSLKKIQTTNHKNTASLWWILLKLVKPTTSCHPFQMNFYFAFLPHL